MEYWMMLSRDITIYIVSIFALTIYSKKASPYQRGFYCDDNSLNLPYKHYKTWHVTNGTLFGVSISVPILCMVSLEYWRVRQAADKVNARTPWSLVCYRIHITLRNWAFAFNAVAGLTEMLKYSVGRLRPHFFNVCSPDWDAITCNDIDGNPLYITDIPCTTTELFRLKEARKSFPSGHALVATFAMMYLIIYLHARLQHGPQVVKHFLQAACAWFAAYTSATRVLDHAHHWTDVAAGASIGAVTAGLSTIFASDIFSNKDIIISETRKDRK
ncbi:unnamed protein product, partial [Meganyctiphanes norvegica]